MSIIEDLKRHEGFRELPYKDTEGFLTIGYGLNIDAGITKEEAEMILVSRVVKIKNKLSTLIPSWNTLNGARQDVLINMAYNIGIDGLLKFKRMLARLNDRNYEEAAQEMKASKWAVQVKTRSTELIETMRDGE